MKEKKIPFLVESERGHDTTLVPENKVVDEAVKQLKEGKWVTTEKKDGTTEVITKDDLDDEDKALAEEWKGKFKTPTASTRPETSSSSATTTKTIAKKFEKVTSVTCTSKAKGG